MKNYVVMYCESAHEIWNKLKTYYEGNTKVKEARIQYLRAQFESLKMEEDEDVASQFLRVDNIVNSIAILCEEIKDGVVVLNFFRYIP